MKNSQIKLGAILSYVSIAVNILAGLIYTPWMINQIGKSDYGLYTLANSLITLFLIDFGLSAAVSRYVSKYIANGEQEKANNFLGIAYKLYLVVDIVIFFALVIVYFCIDSIYIKLTPDEIAKFKVVYSIVAVYSVVSFPFITLNGILTAYEKFIQLKLADIIQRLLMVSLTVIALCNNMGLYSLVTVNALSSIVIIIYKFIVISNATPIKVNFKYNDKSLYKSIFSFTFWSTLTTVAQLLVFNITPTILGVVANTSAIAIFGVVATLESYSYMVTAALKGMFMPQISRIYANETGDIMPLMIKVGRFQMALNGLLIVGFGAVGKTFINIWMGNAFSDAYIGLLLVIVPGMFYNSLQVANTAMIVKNKVKELALITLMTGIINVILSPVLSWYFGVLGACVSISFAYTVRAILCHIIYFKSLDLTFRCFARKCYVNMIVPIIFSLILGLFSNGLLKSESWSFLALKCLIIVIIYFICLFLFSLNKNEKEQIKSYIYAIKNKLRS